MLQVNKQIYEESKEIIPRHRDSNTSTVIWVIMIFGVLLTNFNLMVIVDNNLFTIVVTTALNYLKFTQNF